MLTLRRPKDIHDVWKDTMSLSMDFEEIDLYREALQNELRFVYSLDIISDYLAGSAKSGIMPVL